MSGPIVVPGIVYSLLTALAVWLLDYIAPIDFTLKALVVAGVPILLKMFTVAAGSEPPAAASRGMSDDTSAQRGKMNRFLLG